ncbi:hypothetical protein [Nocardiopsis synnemataformans]|uniref:hypothetical protein n=1 Tax=Nocardiopsis synnemataformans TaxID=61305 RepID=UPI003EC0D850
MSERLRVEFQRLGLGEGTRTAVIVLDSPPRWVQVLDRVVLAASGRSRTPRRVLAFRTAVAAAAAELLGYWPQVAGHPDADRGALFAYGCCVGRYTVRLAEENMKSLTSGRELG